MNSDLFPGRKTASIFTSFDMKISVSAHTAIDNLLALLLLAFFRKTNSPAMHHLHVYRDDEVFYRQLRNTMVSPAWMKRTLGTFSLIRTTTSVFSTTNENPYSVIHLLTRRIIIPSVHWVWSTVCRTRYSMSWRRQWIGQSLRRGDNSIADYVKQSAVPKSSVGGLPQEHLA